MLSVVMLSVVMLSVVMLSVVMLNVVMQSVVATKERGEALRHVSIIILRSMPI